MATLILQGTSALSSFRITTLCDELATAGFTNTSIDSHFVYALECDELLTNDYLTKSYALLNANGSFTTSTDTGFFVTPRKGTISPWSSKATDIFHNCGLTDVKRVERGTLITLTDAQGTILSAQDLGPAIDLLFDPMTEGVYTDISDMFAHAEPAPLVHINTLEEGKNALDTANTQLGLAMSPDEIDYIFEYYDSKKRNPTDVELVMFAQANSEHCRHKIFNADWVIDGETKENTLFKMIRHTHAQNPQETLIAYSDNSGGMIGHESEWFEVAREHETAYGYTPCPVDIIMKVETHNHPTAISPFPGAATGVGGEIRDEGATGVGSKPKAGLSAFMVSNLHIPDTIRSWENKNRSFPDRIASPLQIMLEGPIGGAAFGNEFGRPQLCGFFKTFEETHLGRDRGYHKPIMTAGGMGNIKREHVEKQNIPNGTAIIQLGGPSMRIGVGGGAASSMDTGSNSLELDFNSVQRGNPEMQRRCQEVIDACIALGAKNPVLSAHDIGAGGLSNACPELVEACGATFELRKVHNEEISMSPMEIWCNESQERYMLAVRESDVELFAKLCERERCPFALLGTATGDHHLTLTDEHLDNTPIDLELEFLLGKPPKMVRDVSHLDEKHPALNTEGINLEEACTRVLQLPTVADKTFLITIADRSITGHVARDQMVGPWQQPLADVAVTATGFNAISGEAMAMGEAVNLAVVNAPASGRMAIGESLTNIAAADIGSLKTVKLSANWMAACGEAGEDANLFDTVETIAMDLCPKLGVAIPVGKDSMSMRTVWDDNGDKHSVVSPLSLVITAFAAVDDVTKTLTPDFKESGSALLCIDLGRGQNRLGASCLAQVYNQVGNDVPDLNSPSDLVAAIAALRELADKGMALSYHDRSDGGLFTTLAEMAFGGRKGFKVDISNLGEETLPIVFNEELGMVIEVSQENLAAAQEVFAQQGIADICHLIGTSTDSKKLIFTKDDTTVLELDLITMERQWSETTYKMQSLRDNPICAQEEYDAILDTDDPGMQAKLTYNPEEEAPTYNDKPKMAILREQGINGQIEMGAAFDKAGFTSVDIHMTDLIDGRVDLADFAGLVACGGFSYGDVLGAGSGWAKSILYNDNLKEMFSTFFKRPETFTLGVCNGCQMVSQLAEIIPGAEHWPRFKRNRSEQFEARLSSVEILPSPSVLLKGMEGSIIPIPVAHGEGMADFSEHGSQADCISSLRYVDNRGEVATSYPANPNGSPDALTGLSTTDGRVTIMMPHPERAFRALQLSHNPHSLFSTNGPWLKLFQNARAFIG